MNYQYSINQSRTAPVTSQASSLPSHQQVTASPLPQPASKPEFYTHVEFWLPIGISLISALVAYLTTVASMQNSITKIETKLDNLTTSLNSAQNKNEILLEKISILEKEIIRIQTRSEMQTKK